VSTGLIVAIVIVIALVILVFAVAMPRARARARERELVRRRDEVADAHRAHAEDRQARAEYAEQQAARERAEADLHETRARLHERGLADDELDAERERLGTADTDRGDRFAREPAAESDRDAAIRDDERR
jgi:flagellar biosynthesis/type III secretory pathway M-ring protein FliF/YscJ